MAETSRLARISAAQASGGKPGRHVALKLIIAVPRFGLPLSLMTNYHCGQFRHNRRDRSWGMQMVDSTASSHGVRPPTALRKPTARRYEKPVLVKSDNIIAITAVGSVSAP
jgi:hypothetical protein